MAIKTVKFTGLSSTAMQYTALGGIRFYDESNILIPSGAIISNSEISAETDNFLLTATSGYAGPDYYIANPFDTNALQTGTWENQCYWLSENENQTITCEFKTPISRINKIEFVPLPDVSLRGVDEQFNIELWDEFDALLNTLPITPITANNTVQTVDIVIPDKITTSTGVITNSSAEVLIDVIFNQSTSASYYIEYTTDDTFTTGIQTTSEKVVTTSDTYIELITGLLKGTVYYYRVVATFNVSGEFISSIENFKSYSVITVFIDFFGQSNMSVLSQTLSEISFDITGQSSMSILSQSFSNFRFAILGQANVTAKVLRIANVKTTILSSLNMSINVGVKGSWIELLTEEGAWKKYEGN